METLAIGMEAATPRDFHAWRPAPGLNDLVAFAVTNASRGRTLDDLMDWLDDMGADDFTCALGELRRDPDLCARLEGLRFAARRAADVQRRVDSLGEELLACYSADAPAGGHEAERALQALRFDTQMADLCDN